ncbi:zinc-dependent metalloprotease [Chishuiella changwenlii]|uniref:zinc-dependent metalloprotease n=1 Tax=Chishuiella changwenlii TaxID=1434701 RepID=UPI002FD89FEF
MKKNLLFISLLVVSTSVMYAQNTSQKTIEKTVNSSKKKLDLHLLESQLSSNLSKKSQNLIVSIPNEKHENEQFVLIERDILSPNLKEKFPQIKSYYGYSTTNPLKKISLGYSPKGINTMIYDNKNHYIIEKIEKDYFLTETKDLPNLEKFNCETEHINSPLPISKANKTAQTTENKQHNNPAFYRKYRLAIATDYSYNKFFAKEGEEPTLEDSFSAVNELLTYFLPIYENELSISFELVDHLEKVTFLTEESNPYNYENHETIIMDILNENQKQLDEKIGDENYDLGFLLTGTRTLNNAGVGRLRGACYETYKGQSFSGSPFNPKGYDFSLVVAHEIGHLLGAQHTYSNINVFSKPKEIGGGVTIMGYPGATVTHDVQDNRLPQFHNSSVKDMNNFINTRSCGIMSPSNNTPPIANAGKDYTIPKGTAFKLTGTASDVDNDNLTYSWEQDDTLINHEENVYQNPSRRNTEGANFRVYEHHTNPVQYFPPLDYALNNQLYSTWNTVSDIPRELNFVFHVRDNQPQGGQIAMDTNKVKITDDGPFKITNINLNQSFKTGETFTLKWDVAGTNRGEINTQNVRIKLTTDDGETFTILVESTPNIGHAIINLPADLKAEKANIIVEAIDNIYYAASPFIAIGYEISLHCKTYSNPEPIVAKVGSVHNSTISITDETKPIEDFSLFIDADSPSILILFEKIGFDKELHRIWERSNCEDSTMNYKFNSYGENLFENCGINGTAINSNTFDSRKYISQDVNGEYFFLFDFGLTEEEEEREITVNKFGVELCYREATTLDVTDLNKSQDVFVYPNPTDGLFKVRMTPKTNKITANIINMAGQVIMTKQFDVTNSKVDQTIDAKHLPKGIYIVEIKDGNQSQTKKLIIK